MMYKLGLIPKRNLVDNPYQYIKGKLHEFRLSTVRDRRSPQPKPKKKLHFPRIDLPRIFYGFEPFVRRQIARVNKVSNILGKGDIL